MSSDDLDTFLARMDDVLATLEDDDRSFSRVALILLCVCQRALQPIEVINILGSLYIPDIAGPDLSFDWLRGGLHPRFTPVIQGNPVEYLKLVLGDLSSFDYLAMTSEPIIEKDVQTYPRVTTPRDRGILSHLGLTPQKAHFQIAQLCLEVCDHSLIGTFRDEDEEISLLYSYAWAHWTTHLSLAGDISGSWEIASEAHRMITVAAEQALALSLSLGELLGGSVDGLRRKHGFKSAILVSSVLDDMEKARILLAAIHFHADDLWGAILAKRKGMTVKDGTLGPGCASSKVSNEDGPGGTASDPPLDSEHGTQSTNVEHTLTSSSKTGGVNPPVSSDSALAPAEMQQLRDSEADQIAAEENALADLKAKKIFRGKPLKMIHQKAVEQLEASLARRYAARNARDVPKAVTTVKAESSDIVLDADNVEISLRDGGLMHLADLGSSPDYGLRPDYQMTPVEDKQLVGSLIEAAGMIRAVYLALANPAIHNELGQDSPRTFSPVHVYAQTALILEQLATYASGDDLQVIAIDDAFQVSDPAETNFIHASLVRHDLANHHGTRENATCQLCPVLRTASATLVKRPANISATRWYAALFVDKIKTLLRMGGILETTSINSDTTIQGPTSFDSIPPHLYMPPSHHAHYITSWAPHAVYGAVGKITRRVINCTLPPNVTQTLNAPFPKPIPLDYCPGFSELVSALLTSGYRTALVHGILAVVLNHLRRFCVPWLGAFLFRHPMKDLRLALSNAPDVFLQQTLLFTWAGTTQSFLQRWVFDAVALIVMRFVIISRGRPLIHGFLRPSANQEAAMHLAKIFCWVYGLATFEYILARAINVVSILISTAKLVIRGQHARLALLALVFAHLTKAIFLLLLTWHYIHYAFTPIIRGSIASAVRGRPGLLLALATTAGGVAATLRLRSKLGFMWLELSNFFLILAWLTAVLAFLGSEFVRDPLGLQGSVAWARRCVINARLPYDSDLAQTVAAVERELAYKRNRLEAEREKTMDAKKTD